jgi:hypothetical protein
MAHPRTALIGSTDIEYKDLHTVVTEAMEVFAHLYAYGVSKVTFLSSLTGRTIHNLEDMEFPTPDSFNHKHWCTMPCHKFPKIACATKTAQYIYDWLMHYLQTKGYFQCPSDMLRHTASFLQHYMMDVHICLPYHL